jgi:hypothetical protein
MPVKYMSLLHYRCEYLYRNRKPYTKLKIFFTNPYELILQYLKMFYIRINVISHPQKFLVKHKTILVAVPSTTDADFI